MFYLNLKYFGFSNLQNGAPFRLLLLFIICRAHSLQARFAAEALL